MKIGAEPKKVALLGGLLTAAGVLFYINVFSGTDVPSSPPATAQPAVPGPVRAASKAPPPPNIRRARTGIRGAMEEFKPSFKGLDATGVDPTLRLDLLARVQSVSLEGGGRSLFTFAAAPAPAPKPALAAKVVPKTPEQIRQDQAAEQARLNAPPPKPQAPPITLKFFGYSTPRRDGQKRAFFLDGEDIIVAAEGETIKRRYKVVRISNTSVVMEDTEFKSQQTLAIQQEQT